MANEPVTIKRIEILGTPQFPDGIAYTVMDGDKHKEVIIYDDLGDGTIDKIYGSQPEARQIDDTKSTLSAFNDITNDQDLARYRKLLKMTTMSVAASWRFEADEAVKSLIKVKKQFGVLRSNYSFYRRSEKRAWSKTLTDDKRTHRTISEVDGDGVVDHLEFLTLGVNGIPAGVPMIVSTVTAYPHCFDDHGVDSPGPCFEIYRSANMETSTAWKYLSRVSVEPYEPNWEFMLGAAVYDF